MKKIEHIGIAVKDLDASSALFSRLLGKEPYKMEFVLSEKVNTLFFQLGETKIELLQSDENESTINKFIDKRGEGIHHVAFIVEDIYLEMNRLKNEGFILLNEIPKRGAEDYLICFLHPKSTHGVLIELCQKTS